MQGGLLLPRLQPGKTFFAAFPELKRVAITADIQDLLTIGFPQPIIDEWAARYPNGFNQLQVDAINKHQALLKNAILKP